ncbi:ArsA family ATPase [Halomicrobium sp. HM KBTZ05]|uniref:TRC40/GET3/ArsA family transport-energizing ATPase n=1 Tax=Halomicrobium mukohataei TaxID=57705 RepID=A0A847UCT4_9EURY|nr:TRC40/GET3/ArsA family transport-energizing ATPase [Halomicrobium mukohataei]NLV11275.1 TRC40/GET3/ArsA family transport-energizing ATPase [Halomicrobium mukohataei]
MSELDVETVEEIDAPTGVDAPDYVLYGGKGGVGKTTCAAATALASARDGTATLVVSTDPAHSLSDTLGTEIPAEPARIREDLPLYAAEIDPEAAVGEGPLGMDGDLGGLEQLLGGDDANPLAGSMPGSDEAAAMRLLLQYMDDDRFERVVVDTAPTGHTLRLLELPEAMDSMLGKLLTLKERMSGMLEGLGGMFGDDADQEEMERDLQAMREQIEQLRAILRDPEKTDFRVVMVPEELSVMESERLLDRLDAFGIPAGTLVVNRVLQDLDSVVDTELPDDYVGPNHDDCEFCARRWSVQQDALARSQDLFRGHEVRRVPLLAEEVQGEELLEVVAACLD